MSVKVRLVMDLLVGDERKTMRRDVLLPAVPQVGTWAGWAACKDGSIEYGRVQDATIVAGRDFVKVRLADGMKGVSRA